MKTQYRSVTEMVEDMADGKAFADVFAQRLHSRQLITRLIVLRAKAGLSQQDLAEKFGCTQSKISKLESSADANVRLGDLVEYARAIGTDLQISLAEQNGQQTKASRRPKPRS